MARKSRPSNLVKFGEVYGRGCFKWLINMAPEVGLEPTTLRLTASEFPSPSTAIDCCKSLYTSRLDQFLSALRCYIYSLIATDIELAWAQKWAQSFQSLLDF